MTALLEHLKNKGLITPEDTPEIRDVATKDGTYAAIDADTLQDKVTGEKFRLKNVDAREVDKVLYDPEDGTPVGFGGGQVGGAQQTERIAGLIESEGFTNVVKEGADYYGRQVVDLQNEHGTSLSDQLVAQGVVKPSLIAENHQDQARQGTFALLARKARSDTGQPATEFDKAAQWIDEFVAENSGVPLFRIKAIDEATLAAAKAAEKNTPGYNSPYTESGVQLRSHDRYLNNSAKNPLSSSWDTGLLGVKEGYAGILELIGHETGWEELEDWAEGRKEAAQYDIAKMPTVLTDFRDINGVGDALQYVGNLGALSLPYMAITIGAAAAAPFTGGLSLTAPAAVYAGQVWNEMGDTDEVDKNAPLAIGAGISMAVLDRLGIAGLSNTALLNTAGRNQVIAELGKKGISPGVAEDMITQATKKEMAKFAGNASQFAKKQLSVRNQARALLTNFGTNATREGLTEVGQEAIAALAAHAGAGKDWNDDEFLERLQDRLIEAGVGGAVLGGTFSVPGTVKDIGGWTNVAFGQAAADSGLVSRQERWAQQEADAYGRVRSTTEVSKAAREVKPTGPSAIQRADEGQKDKDARSFSQGFKNAINDLPQFWRGSTRFIFNEQLQDKSLAARELASIFGGAHDAYLSGQTFEEAKHLKLAEYKNMLDTPRAITESFGLPLTNKNKGKVSGIVYGAYGKAEKKDGVVDWDSLVGTEYEQHIPALKNFDKMANRMADRLWVDQKKYNPELGHVKNYAFKHRSVDKAKVEKNRKGFEQDLVNRFGLKHDEAANLTEAILFSNSVNSIDEAFETLRSGFKPSAHQKRTLGLSEDAEFASAWLDDNIFNNLSQMAKSASRYTTHQDYLGPNNEVLNTKFNEMEQQLIAAGLHPDEAKRQTNKAALGMKDYLDAESGNYKRPTSDAGRMFQRVQKEIMFYTTLAGLPLATVASMVELALITKSMDRSTIKALSNSGKELAGSLRNFWNDRDFASPGREILRDTGFFEWEVGAAAVTGVTETASKHQNTLDTFFKAIGLKQYTDFTRAVRGSLAMDYMNDKFSVIDTITNESELTNEQQEARTAIRNLGINLEDVAPLWKKMQDGTLTDEEQVQIQEVIRNASFRWINDAIVLPQTANRPLIYQDPRFALFTQFQGFISAFTANQLPKLYRQAFKGKTPAMKYNAFATMATMIALGYASQYLKDLLKYGKATPYLDDTEVLQRAVNSSGLLGTGERVVNLVNPLYEQRYDTSLGWFFGTVAGESAAVTNVGRAAEAVGTIPDDAQRAYAKGAKLLPIVGPFTQFHKDTGEIIFGE